MRAAAKRIVQNRDVAGRQIERLRRVLHRERHRAQMHRHVIAHRDGLALGIVNGARIIAALLDVGRVRRFAQHRAHLLGDRDQQVAEQLQFDWIGSSFLASSDIHQETGYLLPAITFGFLDRVAVRGGIGAQAPAGKRRASALAANESGCQMACRGPALAAGPGLVQFMLAVVERRVDQQRSVRRA